MDKFYPRSFNMGVRREVYETLSSFSGCVSERTSTSVRIFKGGYACRLSSGASVYHNGSTNLKKLFKQVRDSGIARINLYKKYPESLKTVHLLPAAFTLGVAVLGGSAFLPVQPAADWLCTHCLYARTPHYGTRACASASIPLPPPSSSSIGYGTGFWRAWWNRCICGRGEFEAFKRISINNRL